MRSDLAFILHIDIAENRFSSADCISGLLEHWGLDLTGFKFDAFLTVNIAEIA